MGVHTRIMPAYQRLRIAAEIEGQLQRVDLLIARLDRADAPFADLEDDDPAGDPLDRGEAEGHFGGGLLPDLPRYGVDQRRVPANYAAASRVHHALEKAAAR